MLAGRSQRNNSRDTITRKSLRLFKDRPPSTMRYTFACMFRSKKCHNGEFHTTTFAWIAHFSSVFRKGPIVHGRISPSIILRVMKSKSQEYQTLNSQEISDLICLSRMISPLGIRRGTPHLSCLTMTKRNQRNSTYTCITCFERPLVSQR